jgi:hypothetical protein
VDWWKTTFTCRCTWLIFLSPGTQVWAGIERVIQHHPASILAYWCRVEEWRVQTSEKLRVNTISQIRPSISMGFWLLHINTSSIVRRTIYTTALGIKSLFTPIILEHPPELYQSSGTLWRWVYATFRFFHIYIATLIYLFGFVWSYSPSIHPSTPTEEVYGRNKKKYYKLSRRQNIIINPGDMYTPQQQQQ